MQKNGFKEFSWFAHLSFYLYAKNSKILDEGSIHMMKKEALFWEKREDGKIQCLLCPVGCVIADGKMGVCLGRKNEGGN